MKKSFSLMRIGGARLRIEISSIEGMNFHFLPKDATHVVRLYLGKKEIWFGIITKQQHS